MAKKYDIILFDLDGTISESGEGIKKGIEYALSKTNSRSVDLSDYSEYIGPPLLQTFENFCGLTGENIKIAFDAYVEYYNTKGKYENKVYEGMDTLIKELSKKSKVAVCTSKYEKFAEEVIQILGIPDLFDAVCGSTRDGSRKEKEQIIPYAIETLGGNKNSSVLMVGDTKFDAKGARIANVDFIGVTFGYGKIEDMLREGAKNFAKTPLELRSFLID